MNRIIILLLCFIFVRSSSVLGEIKYPLSLTDHMGNTVTLDSKPKRIASLTLGTDENLWDIADHSRIAVMTAISQADYVSNIAGNIDSGKIMIKDQGEWEKVLNAKPDIVLAATYTRKIADPLIAKGLPVYVFSNFGAIKALEENIKILGKLTGENENAFRIINKMHKTLQSALNKKWRKKIKAVYYSEGRLSGGATTPSDVINAAGLIDACDEFGIVDTVKATPRLISNINPDVILIGEDNKSAEKETLRLFQCADYQVIPAVKAGNLYTIPGKHITTVSYHIVEAVLDAQELVQQYDDKN